VRFRGKTGEKILRFCVWDLATVCAGAHVWDWQEVFGIFGADLD